jgi:hypothetical protein
VLIRCERKILLAGKWLVAGTDLMLEKSTAGWLADQPAEQAIIDFRDGGMCGPTLNQNDGRGTVRCSEGQRWN